MEFLLEVINRFMGRFEDEHAEVEITNNTICKEIVAKQMSQWPIKGKLYAG